MLENIHEIPEFNNEIDYEREYYKLFQENEMKLQQYDQLLKERENDAHLYMSMKNGDYSHMKYDFPSQSQVLAH